MHSLPPIPRQIVIPNGFSHEESAFGIVWRGPALSAVEGALARVCLTT